MIAGFFLGVLVTVVAYALFAVWLERRTDIRP
jgi:predicted PurR-regulated permease PerM